MLSERSQTLLPPNSPQYMIPYINPRKRKVIIVTEYTSLIVWRWEVGQGRKGERKGL